MLTTPPSSVVKPCPSSPSVRHSGDVEKIRKYFQLTSGQTSVTAFIEKVATDFRTKFFVRYVDPDSATSTLPLCTLLSLLTNASLLPSELPATFIEALHSILNSNSESNSHGDTRLNFQDFLTTVVFIAFYFFLKLEDSSPSVDSSSRAMCDAIGRLRDSFSELPRDPSFNVTPMSDSSPHYQTPASCFRTPAYRRFEDSSKTNTARTGQWFTPYDRVTPRVLGLDGTPTPSTSNTLSSVDPNTLPRPVPSLDGASQVSPAGKLNLDVLDHASEAPTPSDLFSVTPSTNSMDPQSETPGVSRHPQSPTLSVNSIGPQTETSELSEHPQSPELLFESSTELGSPRSNFQLDGVPGNIGSLRQRSLSIEMTNQNDAIPQNEEIASVARASKDGIESIISKSPREEEPELPSGASETLIDSNVAANETDACQPMIEDVDIVTRDANKCTDMQVEDCREDDSNLGILKQSNPSTTFDSLVVEPSHSVDTENGESPPVLMSTEGDDAPDKLVSGARSPVPASCSTTDESFTVRESEEPSDDVAGYITVRTDSGSPSSSDLKSRKRSESRKETFQTSAVSSGDRDPVVQPQSSLENVRASPCSNSETSPCISRELRMRSTADAVLIMQPIGCFRSSAVNQDAKANFPERKAKGSHMASKSSFGVSKSHANTIIQNSRDTRSSGSPDLSADDGSRDLIVQTASVQTDSSVRQTETTIQDETEEGVKEEQDASIPEITQDGSEDGDYVAADPLTTSERSWSLGQEGNTPKTKQSFTQDGGVPSKDESTCLGDNTSRVSNQIEEPKHKFCDNFPCSTNDNVHINETNTTNSASCQNVLVSCSPERTNSEISSSIKKSSPDFSETFTLPDKSTNITESGVPGKSGIFKDGLSEICGESVMLAGMIDSVDIDGDISSMAARELAEDSLSDQTTVTKQISVDKLMSTPSSAGITCSTGMNTSSASNTATRSSGGTRLATYACSTPQDLLSPQGFLSPELSEPSAERSADRWSNRERRILTFGPNDEIGRDDESDCSSSYSESEAIPSLKLDDKTLHEIGEEVDDSALSEDERANEEITVIDATDGDHFDRTYDTSFFENSEEILAEALWGVDEHGRGDSLGLTYVPEEDEINHVGVPTVDSDGNEIAVPSSHYETISSLLHNNSEGSFVEDPLDFDDGLDEDSDLAMVDQCIILSDMMESNMSASKKEQFSSDTGRGATNDSNRSGGGSEHDLKISHWPVAEQNHDEDTITLDGLDDVTEDVEMLIGDETVSSSDLTPAGLAMMRKEAWVAVATQRVSKSGTRVQDANGEARNETSDKEKDSTSPSRDLKSLRANDVTSSNKNSETTLLRSSDEDEQKSRPHVDSGNKEIVDLMKAMNGIIERNLHICQEVRSEILGLRHKQVGKMKRWKRNSLWALLSCLVVAGLLFGMAVNSLRTGLFTVEGHHFPDVRV